MALLRIVNDGPTGRTAHFLYEPDRDPDDWFTPTDPIDISHVFSDAHINVSVSDITRADLTAIATPCDLVITPRKMTVRQFRARPRWLRWLGYS